VLLSNNFSHIAIFQENLINSSAKSCKLDPISDITFSANISTQIKYIAFGLGGDFFDIKCYQNLKSYL